VLGWIIVLIGAGIIHFWELYLIDPLLTLGITVFILYNVTKNLQEAFNILLEGVPQHIHIAEVKHAFSSIDGVLGVHDIHVWSLDGETDLLTGHIVVEERLLKTPDQTRKTIKELLKTQHIEHSTIELETVDYCSGIECEAWHSEHSQTN
jgi:cobalt-zinc-cadmium efflux system protein